MTENTSPSEKTFVLENNEQDITGILLPSMADKETTLALTEKTSAEIREEEKQLSSEWKAGDIIAGLYQVMSVLGEGAFGTVYKVRHRGWNRILAVKSMHPRLTGDEEQKKNFLDECQGWVNMGLHPNVVSAFYVRDIGNIPRIFIEYIDGGSLAESLKSGKIKDFSHIIDLAIQCLDGLSFAHRKGLIHRDVKPLNCLLTGDGTLKLTDFGIATGLRDLLSEEKKSEKEDIKAVGTPAYMPPEQWSPRHGATGPWSDIYSFGIMLYEMCCKKRPFDDGCEPVLVLRAKHLTVEVPPPKELNRDIPDSLSGLILKCLKKNPMERFQTVQECRIKLAEIYEEITGKPCTRRVTEEIDLLADSLNNRAVSFMDLGLKKEALKNWDEALKIDASHIQSTYNRGLVKWRSGEIDDMELVESLGHCEKTWETYYLTALVHMERDDPKKAEEVLNKISFPFRNNQDVLKLFEKIRDIEKKSTYRINSYKDTYISSMVFSKDEKTIFAACEHLFHNTFSGLYNPDTNKWARPVKFDRGNIKSVSITDDSMLGAVGFEGGEIQIIDLGTGKILKTIKDPSGNVTSCAISPDGRWIGSCGFDCNVRIFDISTGETVKTFEGHSKWGSAMAFMPDRKHVISAAEDGYMFQWDIKTGKKTSTVNHENAIKCMAISYDGTKAITASMEMKLWYLKELSPDKIAGKHRDFVKSVSLNQDGTLALSGGADRTVKLWDTHRGKCLRSFDKQERDIKSVLLSKDGKKALWADESGRVELWHIEGDNFFNSAGFVLSRIKSTGDISKEQLRFNQLIEHAGKAVSLSSWKNAINLLREARAIPGYERSKEALDLWQELYSPCKKISIKEILPEKTLVQHESEITAIELSQDGNHLISSSEDGTILMKNLSDNIEPFPIFWNMITMHSGFSSVKYMSDIEKEYGRGKNIARKATELLTGSLLSVGCNRKIISSHNDKQIRIWDSSATGNMTGKFSPHKSGIYSIDADSHGTFLITSGTLFDKTARLWDLNSGHDIREFNHDADMVVALSDDGERALTLSLKGQSVKIWDVLTGKCRNTINISVKEDQYGPKIAFISKDFKWALTSGYSKIIKLWNLQSGKCANTITEHKDEILALSMSCDGKVIISACKNNIYFYDSITGQCIKTLPSLEDQITGMKLSHDGGTFFTVHKERKIKIWRIIWELEEPEEIEPDENVYLHMNSFVNNHTVNAFNLPAEKKPSPCDIKKRLARSGEPLWNEADLNKLIKTLGNAGYEGIPRKKIIKKLEEIKETYVKNRPEYIRLTEEGERAIILKNYQKAIEVLRHALSLPGYEEGEEALELWQSLYGKSRKISVRNVKLISTIDAHKGRVNTVSMNKNYGYTLSGGHDGLIRKWYFTSEQTAAAMGEKEGTKSPVLSVTSGNKVIFSGHEDGKAILWGNGIIEFLKKVLEGHKSKVTSVCLSSDERFALTGSGDGTLKLWEPVKGYCLKTFTGHKGEVNSVALSNDSQLVFSCSSDRTVKIWNVITGKCIKTLEGHSNPVICMSIGGNSRYILSGDVKQLRLWDTGTGECLTEMEVKNLRSVFLTYDCLWAFTAPGSREGSFDIWNLTEGKCISNIQAHEDEITSISASSDSLHIITAGRDGKIKLWKGEWDLLSFSHDYKDERSVPYIEDFINCHIPYYMEFPEDRKPSGIEIRGAIMRKGKPEWKEWELNSLMSCLNDAGTGWMGHSTVKELLEQVMFERMKSKQFIKLPDNVTKSLETVKGHVKRIAKNIFFSRYE
ncbi:MAG: protein kinase [Candidatus Eremiobacterota bacterium]